jgi:hypothetical protein
MYATSQEVLTAIHQLSDADYLRLNKVARSKMGGTPYQDPHELVTHAISTAYCAAAGQGGRRWPTRVAFVAYLIRTIQGIASDARRAVVQRRTVTGLFVPGEETGEGNLLPFPDLFSASAEEMCADEEAKSLKEKADGENLKTVIAFFREDRQVLAILWGILEELDVREIQARSGMSRTQYDSAHRRWRRGLDRLFPERRSA